MIDPDERERVALLAGGGAGGEYLDSLGISDLAKLGDDQWFQFLGCVLGGFAGAMQAFQLANDGISDEPPPF